MADGGDFRSALEIEADRRYAALRDGLGRDAVVIGRLADVQGLIVDAKGKGRTMDVLDAVTNGAEAPVAGAVAEAAPVPEVIVAAPPEAVASTVVVKPVIDRLLIAGLSDRVRAACSGIAAAREAASGLQDATRAFVANANEITKQVSAANEDLVFQATKLGNLPPTSGE